MSKVYTKSGDKGETGLVGGTRVSKSDLRIDLYGEVDELNSFLGMALSFLEKEVLDSQGKVLSQIQHKLFDLGSNLACEIEKRSQFQLPQIKEEDIELLESSIDLMDGELEALKNFVLPGGHKAASTFHVCRTVCRKVERKIIAFNMESGEELPENSQRYLNRLSDYFFVISRFVNLKANVEEVLWVPASP